MARIRSIKPEIRRSPTVCSWPYAVRWTFAGLPGYCDDEGRAIDDVRLIKAELYPIDDDMTARKLEQHLIAIATNGPLCRYEVDGRRYLHLTSFAEHQRVNRPTPSRIPPCPIHERHVKTHAPLTEPSPPHAQARVPAEQGKEQGAGSREPGTEKGSGKGAAAAAGDGGIERQLLDEHLAHRAMPGIAAAALEHQISECLKVDGCSPDVVRTALAEWRRRPGAKPGLLPHLVSDELARPAAPDPDDPLAGLDSEARAWVAEQQAARQAGATR